MTSNTMTSNAMLRELISDAVPITAAGTSEPVAVTSPELLLRLTLRETAEQQALTISVQASPDGVAWGQPFAALPQVFYPGEWMLRIQPPPQSRAVRVQWQVQRWGRGSLAPWCRFQLAIGPGNPGG